MKHICRLYQHNNKKNELIGSNTITNYKFSFYPNFHDYKKSNLISYKFSCVITPDYQ
jgi:hypothetical protein